ncbi:unnamed protein product [Gadus morhua 'NCC']
MDSYLRCVFILVLLTPLMHLGSSDLRGSHCYIKESKNWREADQHCRTHYSGLLTVRDAEHEATHSGDGWVGLRRTDGVWTWAGGQPLGVLHWENDDEPKDDKHCAQWKSGGLISEDCTNGKKFYCADQNLVLISEEKTWEEALQHCRDLPLSRGMCHDLATLETHDDHVFAKGEAKTAATDEVWTGLRYLRSRWFWVGDGDKAIRHELPACPDQNNLCGAMSGSSLDVRPRNCTEKKNFFCQRRACGYSGGGSG